jgi:hypothetical protein
MLSPSMLMAMSAARPPNAASCDCHIEDEPPTSNRPAPLVRAGSVCPIVW